MADRVTWPNKRSVVHRTCHRYPQLTHEDSNSEVFWFGFNLFFLWWFNTQTDQGELRELVTLGLLYLPT